MTQTNQHTVDRSQDDKISLLYQIGNSIDQIADQLDLDRSRVRRSLSRTGTPRRGKSDGARLRREMSA